MQTFNPDVPSGRQLVQGYGDGAFTISGVAWTGSVLVLPDRTLAWPVADLGGLTAESVAAVGETDPRPEILLVGCGRSFRPLPAAFRNALRALGITAEPMDTGAACRTFNVLLAEERRVAAALIAV